ncbi:carboxypeptidase-like regulatory domain-containing protein [Stenotrophomonas sp. HITSZ_GD]|uniref:carboxypeptidase-like regulatory domain-containing protein n=1 Tax=Stenotrophomonas sp. HITSZ_GD TaxID=3037248 RepID=UPI00240E8ACE|nr:carboxypeptidase-like regulatory domain-containing protein [Stenotrophomonas sp. HITSZ_GD]MDG2526251.1 carboxypeptidase-like regulatory domain-containing protein [Stenotrophomonas sp. HITSZ_GD]
MNRTFWAGVAALVLWLLSDAALAAQVRGRVDFYGPSGVFPMVNAQVALCAAPGACPAATVTGADGMYYLQVPPGNYQLVINGMTKQQLQVPDVPLFDVAPLPGNR